MSHSECHHQHQHLFTLIHLSCRLSVYFIRSRPLAAYGKRESCASSATTTTLLGPPNCNYISQRGSNGALHLHTMPRAISPLMQVNKWTMKTLYSERKRSKRNFYFFFSFSILPSHTQQGLDENSVWAQQTKTAKHKSVFKSTETNSQPTHPSSFVSLPYSSNKKKWLYDSVAPIPAERKMLPSIPSSSSRTSSHRHCPLDGKQF